MFAVGIAPSAALAVAIDGLPSHRHLPAIAAGLGAGLADAAGFVLLLRALNRGSLAIVSPIAATEGGFAALISVLFGTSISSLAAIALPTAVAGSALSATTRGRRTAKGVPEAVGAAALLGLLLVLFARAEPAGTWTAIAAVRIGASAGLLPLVLACDRARPQRRTLGLIALASVLDLAGFAAFATALHHGAVPVVAVAAAQYATVGVLLCIVVLRERPARHQLAGIALTIAGVCLLAAAT